MPPKLTAKKIKTLQKEREKKIKEQAQLILDIAKKDPPNLQSELEKLGQQKVIKADALELALTTMRSAPQHFSSNQINSVTSAWDTQRLSSPKINRSLEKTGSKKIGVSQGGEFRKLPKNEKKNDLKHNKTVLLKESGTLYQPNNQGEQICEYLTMNLAGARGSQFYPKGRLYNHEGKTLLSSTFIDNFQTIESYTQKTGDKTSFKLTKDAKGFGRVFADNALFADFDSQAGNVGLKTLPDGSKHWTRIDYGKGLSYSTTKDAITTKKLMIHLSGRTYSEEMFQGAEFACDLYQATNDIDIDRYKNIIDISFKNLKKAKGDDYLSHPETQDELKSRFSLPEETVVTEELIKETIISNTIRLKEELKEMAKEAAKEAIKEAVKNKDIKSLQLLNQHTPETVNNFIKEAIKDKETKSIKKMLKLSTKLSPSPLKQALNNNEPELAINMVKHGFSLKKEEVSQDTKKSILKSSSLIK
ncbi:MAG: hypothetical protein N4A31_03955, partial [Rickettsiales bacterium]|nr:hypothetical protein [Rickettsiales bacterium]